MNAGTGMSARKLEEETDELKRERSHYYRLHPPLSAHEPLSPATLAPRRGTVAGGFPCLNVQTFGQIFLVQI